MIPLVSSTTTTQRISGKATGQNTKLHAPTTMTAPSMSASTGRVLHSALNPGSAGVAVCASVVAGVRASMGVQAPPFLGQGGQPHPYVMK